MGKPGKKRQERQQEGSLCPKERAHCSVGKGLPNHWDNCVFPGQNLTSKLPMGADEAKVVDFLSGAGRKPMPSLQVFSW